MTRRHILTIDVGTSSTKTALWDEAGNLLSDASSAYSLTRRTPLEAEIDAEIWWQAVCATVREVMAASGVDPRAVSAIGVDGVGWTLLPVDRDAQPLFPALIWLDRRAEEEAQWLNGRPEASMLVKLAANPIDAAYVTPKLVWLRRHHPDVFNSAYRFLSSSAFIVARLTGEFICDTTQAYGYHFFDISGERWDETAAKIVGVPLEKMPRLCSAAEVVGTVSAQAAEQTGLVPGIPVIAGCLDAAAGALGAGVTRPGQTNEQGGQAGGVGISVEGVLREPQLIFSHHVLPGQYLLQAGTVGGGSLRWFRDVLEPSEPAGGRATGQGSFEQFSRQAAEVPPGAHGLIFIPYMAGERTPLWNSQARGVLFGLSYKTTRADMLRAVMEGCAFAVYDNVQIAHERGVAVSEYLGSGGATRSAVWCQIKADIYNRPFVVARRADGGEGGHGLGLYALAAQALGLCEGAGECVDRLLSQRQVFEPSPQRHALYRDLFQVYRNVSRRLLPEFEHMATIAQKHGPLGHVA